MPLSTAERKHRLPFGSQKEIAEAEGVSEAYVSLAVADEIRPKTKPSQAKLRRIRARIARKLGVSVAEAYPAVAA